MNMAAARPAAPIDADLPPEFKLYSDAIAAVIGPPLDSKQIQACLESAKKARETPLTEIFTRIIKNDETEAWNILWARIKNADPDDFGCAKEWLEREEKAANHFATVNFLTLLGVVKEKISDYHDKKAKKKAKQYFERAEALGGIYARLHLIEIQSIDVSNAEFLLMRGQKTDIDAVHSKIITCYQQVIASSQAHVWYSYYKMLSVWPRDDKYPTLFPSIAQLPSVWANAVVGGHPAAIFTSFLYGFFYYNKKIALCRLAAKSGSYDAARDLGECLLRKAKLEKDDAAFNEARAWLIPVVEHSQCSFGKLRAAKLLLQTRPEQLSNEIFTKCVFLVRNDVAPVSKVLATKMGGVGLVEFFVRSFRANPNCIFFIYMAAVVVHASERVDPEILAALNQYATRFPEEFLICVKKLDDRQSWRTLGKMLEEPTKQILKSCLAQPKPELVKLETYAALGFFPRVLTHLVNDFVRPRFYLPEKLLAALEVTPEMKAEAPKRTL